MAFGTVGDRAQEIRRLCEIESGTWAKPHVPGCMTAARLAIDGSDWPVAPGIPVHRYDIPERVPVRQEILAKNADGCRQAVWRAETSIPVGRHLLPYAPKFDWLKDVKYKEEAKHSGWWDAELADSVNGNLDETGIELVDEDEEVMFADRDY
jgi:hypothetical protein